MTIKQRCTRFRAYQIGSAGSSFSYFNGSKFTLIEARYTDGNKESIERELEACGVDNIYNLHITSWDQDHCVPNQLEEINQRLSAIAEKTRGLWSSAPVNILLRRHLNGSKDS